MGQSEWKPLEIKSFSQKPEDFPGWKEHVELAFTKFAALPFLTLMQTWKESPERSNSYVSSLREALKDSIISAAADKHKNKTCYEFWSAILSCFNNAVLQHLKVFKSWYSTFQHRCNAVSEFAEYKNDFETDLQALETHKAPGLKDQALLCTVILCGILCQQLDDTLHELQLIQNSVLQTFSFV